MVEVAAVDPDSPGGTQEGDPQAAPQAAAEAETHGVADSLPLDHLAQMARRMMTAGAVTMMTTALETMSRVPRAWPKGRT